MRDTDVTILGAGLCGTLLSIMLARRGVDVTLLEREPDPRLVTTSGGRSINLAMAARGIHALRYAGVYDVVEPMLVPMKGRRIHNLDGSTELHLYGQKDNEVIYSVSRAKLNRVLVEAAEQRHNVAIRFNQQAMSYDPASATLRVCDPRTSHEHEVAVEPLIAADGAGSIVRRAYSGIGRIGASEELLQHGYRELVVPSGPGGAFLMDQGALHIWPRGGFMLIALPNPGGDFTLTLFLPNEGVNSFRTLSTDSALRTFFLLQFPDVLPLIDDLVDTWNNNQPGMLGTVRCRHWHDEGRMLLIGDAAHAIVPFHGQGMNLSFEDCVILDEVIERTNSDWAEIFAAFEHARIDNANAIADMALENYVEMRDTVRHSKYLLQKELAFALERRCPQRFIPRYSMVMFHDEIPYADAQHRGAIQQQLLAELTDNAISMDDIDLDAAVTEVEKRLAKLT